MVKFTLNRIYGRLLVTTLLLPFAIALLSVSFFMPGICMAEDSETEYRNESFAYFLYLTDRERDIKDSVIYFYTPDTIDGYIHSNDTIHIEGSSDYPVFWKRVTTSSNYMPRNLHVRFGEGWGYRSRVVFPDSALEIRRFNGIVGPNGLFLGSADPATMTQIAISHDTLFVRYCFIDPDSLPADTVWRCSPSHISDGDKYLIPSSGCVFINGKVLLSAAKRFGSNPRPDTTDGPFPFLPPNANNTKTFISAGLEGRLTMGTSDTLIIGEDLVYNHCRSNFAVPSTMDSCADILGLVSEQFIMFGKSTRLTTHINAALAALKGSISVQDIYDYIHTNWKQSLFIYGSLAQRNRGKIHTGEIGHERGFREKDFHYDVRFQDNPPPHFPKTQGN